MAMHPTFAKNALQKEFGIAATMKGEGIPVYYPAGDLAKPGWLDKVAVGVQRFFFDQGHGIQYADFQGVRITTVVSTDPATRSCAAMDCLNEARKAGLVTPETEIRLLELPQIGIMALWLHAPDKDTFMPYNMGRGVMPRYEADPDFLSTVMRRAAEKKAAYDTARAAALARGFDPDRLGG